MANNIQDILSALKPKEEEQLFTPNNQPQQEELMSIMPQPENIVQSEMSREIQQSQTPSNTEQVKTEALIPPAPPVPNKSMTKLEKLESMLEQLGSTSNKELEEARRQDRMLKVGGALGDALATYLNARSQMNVMAPGVQVQQGAGLGKVADMFATAPEIAGDIKARREALLKQYGELAKGERAQARLTSQEKIANTADLRARELAQMQIEGNLKAAAIKASGKGELTPYQQMRKEEAQLQKQEKDLKSLKEIETRKRTIEDNIERAKALVTASGTFEMFGPQSEELNSIIDEISVDMAKLQDPDSVARPNEVALVRKNLIPESAMGKLGMRDETAIKLLDKFKERVDERAKIGYQVRGIKAPMGEEAVKPNQTVQLVKIKAPSGAIREVSQKNAEEYLKRPGYSKVK